MLSPPDVQTSTILVLSGSGIPGPDAGVGTPVTAAVAAGEAPSPAACSQSCWRPSRGDWRQWFGVLMTD